MLFELRGFEHFDATSTSQAVSILARYGGEGGGAAAVIAGGTDLLALLKDKVEGPGLRIPEVLVNIKPIGELQRISDDRESATIGAAVTLAQLVESDLIRERLPALREAARLIGTTQLRNMGTLGGNLCQRPRCMYFRHPDFPCLRKGGRKCFAVSGEHRDYHAILGRGTCAMAHPSDTAPVLVALRAEAVIVGPAGDTTIPLTELFSGPDASRETVLLPDQLLKEIRVPLPGRAGRQVFLKHRVRHSADFALASVAAAVEMSDGLIRTARVVLGGVAPIPLLAGGVEEVLRGSRPDEKLLDEAADVAVQRARPLPHNRYKVDLLRALIRRALALAVEPTGNPRGSAIIPDGG
jgi:xanthine dehydrogenase YagS FAD-binding subunit